MSLDSAVEIIHRVAGYPLAFVAGPWALATFAGKRGHHNVGKVYAFGMAFLYLSGTALTLTRHPWGTWEFGRNVAFNLFGFSLLFHGWRAIWRMNSDQPQVNTSLDRALLGLHVALVALLVTLALQRSNSPMHVFAVLGIVLLALDIRDWRAGFTTKRLYARHVRYILGSYFYVLTVVSIVHLRDELPNDARWLWPSVLGAATIWLVGEGRATTKWTMRALLALSVAFGAYAVWEVARDHGHIERVLGAVHPPLEARLVVQVEA